MKTYPSSSLEPLPEETAADYAAPKMNYGTRPEHSVEQEAEKSRQVVQKCNDTDQLLSILNNTDKQVVNQVVIAAEKGDYKAVYAILHQGVQSDLCLGMGGYTPLHHACNRGHFDIVQLIIQQGCTIDQKNSDGETALHLAAYNGNLNIVELLIDKGADIQALTKDGETALFYASRKGNVRAVRILIRRGIDANVKNRFGDIAEDEVKDSRTRLEFSLDALEISDRFLLGQEELVHVFRFLDTRSLCRSSQVSDRWHRASEDSSLWKVSRWEMMLSARLGLGVVSPMAGYRPSRSSKGKNKRPSSTGSNLFLASESFDKPASRPQSASTILSRRNGRSIVVSSTNQV